MTPLTPAAVMALAQRVHTIMNERDAAIAERDALKRTWDDEVVRLRNMQAAYTELFNERNALRAAITEARRVLVASQKGIRVLEVMLNASGLAGADIARVIDADIASVLAQEEK